MSKSPVDALVAARKSGHGLPAGFYHDAEIFERDLQQIFLAGWQYAGHVSQLPKIGDYLLFEMAGESVIVVRSEAGYRALLNVCRHRGSRICQQQQGQAKRLVCPYHGWSYALSGELLAAAELSDEVDRSRLGLKRVALDEIEGLLFINFAAKPSPFRILRHRMGGALKAHGLADLKVAHSIDYSINANWKLAVENYCECYHCRPSHKAYSKGHQLAVPRDQWLEGQAQANQLAKASGFSQMVDGTWLNAPKAGLECQYAHYPLVNGHVTGSEDGQPVAPLIGSLQAPVALATDFQLGPNLFGLIYSDHAVLYRFLPVSVAETVCQVSWLVRAGAREGQDYALPKLIWLWDTTTREDKTIIEQNQLGVSSRYYRPGPFTSMEVFASRFVDWYLARLDGQNHDVIAGR
ncbi:MAG: (2Fe-2S)-binding protein [Lysobacteraceae bacterium]|nr:MAG: (2Fe-2S)-binding protein [Xanthomonadaceae bacterium]